LTAEDTEGLLTRAKIFALHEEDGGEEKFKTKKGAAEA